MVVVDGRTAHEYVSQVIEFDDCFSIMNQLYEKDNLLPRRFCFLETPTTTPMSESLWKKTIYVQATPGLSNSTVETQSWRATTQKNPMIQNSYLVDSKNTDIIYMFRNSVYDPSPINNTIHNTFVNSQLVKFIKNGKRIDQDKCMNIEPDVRGTISNFYSRDGKYLHDFLGQTDEYIWVKCVFTYYKFSNNNSANSEDHISKSYVRIKCFSKKDLSTIYNVNLGFVNTELIAIKNNYIYLSCSGDNNIYSIKRINMINGSINDISRHDELGINFYCTPTTINTEDCSNSFYISRSIVINNLYKICIQKYFIDFQNDDSVFKTDVELQNFNLDDFLLTEGKDYITTLTSHTDNDGQKYINLIIHGYGNNAGQQSLHSIILFQYENDLTLLCRNIIRFDPELFISGVFSIRDNKVIVLAGTNFVYFLRWSETLKTFIYANKYVTSVKNLGIDTNENIWIQRTDNVVEMLSVNKPLELILTFEKEKYYYENKAIDTYLSVTSKNYLGEFVYADIEIILTGNLHFKENHSKMIKLQTSGDGVINIPVTITDSGVYSADINYI